MYEKGGRDWATTLPCMQDRTISREDLEDVRASEEFTSDDALQRLELPVKGGGRAALARL